MLYPYGGTLCRYSDSGKYHAVNGTKGYRWLPASEVKDDPDKQMHIDKSYYDALVTDAINSISALGDYDWFVEKVDVKTPDDFTRCPIYTREYSKDEGFHCGHCEHYNTGDVTNFEETCKQGFTTLPF